MICQANCNTFHVTRPTPWLPFDDMVSRRNQPLVTLDLGEGRAHLFCLMSDSLALGPPFSLLLSWSGNLAVSDAYARRKGGERRPSGWRLHAGDGLDYGQITPAPKFRLFEWNQRRPMLHALDFKDSSILWRSGHRISVLY